MVEVLFFIGVTMSTQIIYTDNIVAVSPTSLNWPTTYVKADGTSSRMPNPSIPIKYGYKTNSLLLEFESGHEQRREKGLMRRTFEFTYNVVTSAVADELENFFVTCRGSVRAFNWTDPATSKTYVCRFDGDTFSREYFAHSSNGPLFRVVVKLIQVI